MLTNQPLFFIILMHVCTKHSSIFYMHIYFMSGGIGMRISARAIIIYNNCVLAMFRRRKNEDGTIQEYYVIPGGGQDEGETLEQTVTRELQEELNVEIQILGYVGSQEYKDTQSHFYHCTITKGVPQLGGEELDRMSESNFYEPRYIPLDQIHNVTLAGAAFVEKAVNKKYIPAPNQEKTK